jgi:hypothetical protein
LRRVKVTDSKYALTVVQELMALAEITDTSRAAVWLCPPDKSAFMRR